MGEEEEDKVEVRFLSDDPTSEDQLQGRGMVASAIADVFRSDEKGKAIALTGTWGSGKSSIVRMVKEMFKPSDGQKPEEVIIDFDAWCHKGDPLRCAFLVELGDRLSDPSIGWLNEDWWKNGIGDEPGVRDKITKRTTTTTTRTTPLLTKGGKYLAIALLLFPIAVMMLAAYSANHVLGWCGFGLSILLFLTILASYGYAWHKARVKAKKDGTKTKVRFFLEERETDVSSTEFKTPDPTSFEFKDYFRGIIKKALYDDNGRLIGSRKLMIVIDNLDRVDHADARTIWATMQTFFERSSTESQEEYKARVWLLVPFDLDGMARIWSPDEDQKVDRTIANSFKDKAFQIAFHVPPPVLLNWKDFFDRKVRYALPGHEDDYYELYRLYDLRSEKVEGVTPRGIILFINKLGALHLQWNGNIPLIIQGLYVLWSEMEPRGKTEEEHLREFIEGPPPRFRAVIDEYPEWETLFAALHFNVDPEDSLQATYKSTIKELLRAGNQVELARKAAIRGIPELSESCIDEDISEYQTRDFTTVASALVSFDAVESDTPNRMWRKLYRGFKKAPQISALDGTTGAEISEIVGHVSALGLQESLEVAVAKIGQIDVAGPEENADVIFNNWLDGALRVIEKCHEIAPGGDWRQSFCVPSDTHYMSMIIRLTAEGKPDDIMGYFVSCPDKTEGIFAHLQETVSSGQYSDEYVAAVDKISSLGTWPWDILSRALSGRLCLDADLGLLEVKVCLKSLLFLAYKVADSTAVGELGRMSGEGQLPDRLAAMIAPEVPQDVEAIALASFPILLTNPNGEVPNPYKNSQAGIDYYLSLSTNPEDKQPILDQLSTMAINYRQIRPLVELALPTKSGAVASRIVDAAAVREDAAVLLPGALFLQHYTALRDAISDDHLGKLTETLMKNDDLISKIYAGGFRQEHVGLYSKILLIQPVPDESEGGKQESAVQPDPFINFLVENLQAIEDPETWSRALGEPDGLVGLLLQLVRGGRALNLGIPFSEPLRDDILGTMKAEERTIKEIVRGNADFLLAAMNKDAREHFLADIFNFAALEQNTVAPLLEAFGVHLYSDLSIEKEEKNYLLLFQNILSRTDVVEVSWIADALRNSPKLLENARGEMSPRLLEIMKGKLDQPNLPVEYLEHVFVVGDLLGEDLRPQNEEAVGEVPALEEKPPGEEAEPGTPSANG
jgi:energy-coupling factor transporter ATP-binding protein EcfA2